MGAEVAESKLDNSFLEARGEENASLKQIKGQRNEFIGPFKGEGNKVSEINCSKDEEKEWPTPLKTHSFFFVKYRPFEDQTLKAKLEQFDKELQRKNQYRSQLIEKLRAKKSERAKLLSQLKALNEEKEEFQLKVDLKKKEMGFFQQALGHLRGGSNGGRSALCSSEEELNNLIKSLQYRIEHESICLNEEKQILREIKQLEGTREKVIQNAALRAQIQQPMGEKEALQDQVKFIRVDLDAWIKNRQLLKTWIKELWEEKQAIDKEITSLEEELTTVKHESTKTLENIREMRKQHEAANSSFYQYRSILNKAKDLAVKKDVEGLRSLSETEVNNFFYQWNSNKAFKEDYVRRIPSSLEIGQLSRDGRITYPNEKPILQVLVTPPEVEAVNSSVQNDEKEKKDAKQRKEVNIKKKGTKAAYDVEDTDEFFIPDKLRDSPPKVEMLDEQRLKEKRREEEIVKAKKALDRKEKFAEKAAAKAAIRSQKEAEKKQKERKKRLKKKAGTSVADPDHVEQSAEIQLAKAEEAVETPSPQKKTESKKNAFRHRKRSKGLNSLPKALLKRKKSKNYWMWASLAALALILFVIAGWIY